MARQSLILHEARWEESTIHLTVLLQVQPENLLGHFLMKQMMYPMLRELSHTRNYRAHLKQTILMIGILTNQMSS